VRVVGLGCLRGVCLFACGGVYLCVGLERGAALHVCKLRRAATGWQQQAKVCHTLPVAQTYILMQQCS
jgi:hypothetical protein